jgi:radical SAM/Cys-rich protein
MTFANTLKEHGLVLFRERTATLQVNVGYLCNLTCKHCHLAGGPARTEAMDRQTMREVIGFARRNAFETADITGGAPEMVPGVTFLIDGLRPHVGKMLLRSNLTLFFADEYADIRRAVMANRVAIVASLPSVNESQTDSQRGAGVWRRCLDNLRRLNDMGYGLPGTGLELMLVANPAGAFMPADQCRAEQKFKADLARKWGIQFNSLFTFANVPLGRFGQWLQQSGNLPRYMEKLTGSFNPATVARLMCRTLISVSWNGQLYDCDFNQAADLPHGGKPTHLREIDRLGEGTAIVTGDHCYACTAGAGFT